MTLANGQDDKNRAAGQCTRVGETYISIRLHLHYWSYFTLEAQHNWLHSFVNPQVKQRENKLQAGRYIIPTVLNNRLYKMIA